MKYFFIALLVVLLVINVVSLIVSKITDRRSLQCFIPPCGKSDDSEREYEKAGNGYVKVFQKKDFPGIGAGISGNNKFLGYINQWLADNPRVKNVRFEVSSWSNRLLFQWEDIREVKLFFDISETDIPYQYALTEVEKHAGHILFPERTVKKWRVNNPNAEIIQNSGGYINTVKQTTTSSDGGVGTSVWRVFQIVFLLRYRHIDGDTFLLGDGTNEDCGRNGGTDVLRQGNRSGSSSSRKKYILFAAAALLVCAAIVCIWKSSMSGTDEDVSVQMCGSTAYSGLEISATQTKRGTVRLDIFNTVDHGYTFGGWGLKTIVELVTDTGEYYYNNDTTGSGFIVRPHEETSLDCFFPDAEGVYQELRICHVRRLKGGIPASSGNGDEIIVPLSKNEETESNMETQGRMISGITEMDGLILSVSQEEDTTIELQYENKSNWKFRWGWVDAPVATLVTDRGEYTYVMDVYKHEEVLPGKDGSLTLYFDGAEGNYKELSLPVVMLGDDGLPAGSETEGKTYRVVLEYAGEE